MEAHARSNMHVLLGLESPGRHSTGTTGTTSTGAHTFHISPRSQVAGASTLEPSSDTNQGWRGWLSRVTVLGLQPTPELVAIGGQGGAQEV